ncbi:hypothetical protein BDV25DRAFT_63871 [Aspergillus avenaceus]|uniref:Uncharacterized protein n=1 Tax=Aspergillus avenaceus TaxID=36643 RepID=A0A5N6U8L5_ASPAV|nr:hypothetical protein BDV25DRAFT_63871 [Aspergillus avenaceus]
MAVINQNMTPPAPPVHHAPVQPPLNPALYQTYYPGVHPGYYHHLPVHPTGHPTSHPTGHHREAPRAINNPTTGPSDPTRLVDEMARLNVNVEKATPGSQQKAPEPAPAKEISARGPFFYIGFTFYKAEAIPGQKSNWNNVDKTQLHLTQAELVNMVQVRAKKHTGLEQYQTLSKAKRTHVDQLINELKKGDPRFEWSCVYVKDDIRRVRGKNNRRGDYETLSLDVVVMGKPITSPRPRTSHTTQVTFELPPKSKEKAETKVENPVVKNEPRSANRDLGNGIPWTRPVMSQGQQPPMVHNVQQFIPQMQQQPPPPPQQQPPPPPPQPQPQIQQRQPQQQQPPPPPPPPAHPGMRPFINQAQLPQRAPAAMSHGVHPQPDIYHAATAALGKGPAIEVLHHGSKGVPVGADPNRLSQGFNHAQKQTGTPGNNAHVGKEAFSSHEQIPQGGSVKAPNPAAEPEPEWAPDTSSIGDDESELFDLEDLSSITDDSEGEQENREKSQVWRGSLFRRHSSHSRRPNPTRYRSHYRKLATGAGENRPGRTKYPKGYVDVIPGDSKESEKQVWRTHSREVSRPTRDRPKVIHNNVNTDELDAIDMEKYHGLRSRNDIRSRILDDREARIERREQLVDYRARMLDERWDEACYLGRRMSMRDPNPFYHRQYYAHDSFH